MAINETQKNALRTAALLAAFTAGGIVGSRVRRDAFAPPPEPSARFGAVVAPPVAAAMLAPCWTLTPPEARACCVLSALGCAVGPMCANDLRDDARTRCIAGATTQTDALACGHTCAPKETDQ